MRLMSPGSFLEKAYFSEPRFFKLSSFTVNVVDINFKNAKYDYKVLLYQAFSVFKWKTDVQKQPPDVFC